MDPTKERPQIEIVNIMPGLNSHERHGVDILLTAGIAAALLQKDT